MNYARIGRSERLVEASEAMTRKDYTCPTCGGRVFLRSGDWRAPHFAHHSGEGSAECDDYHPAFAYPAESTPIDDVPIAETQSEDNELDLIVEDYGGSWGLFLKLPEVSAEELGVATIASLREGRIEATLHGNLVTTVSALNVSPGGVARASVPPSSLAYRTRPTGVWPAGVDTKRWNAFASGLEPNGTLFRERAGEWSRVNDGSLVRWGSELLLIADENNLPPDAARPQPNKVISDNERSWSMCRINLPLEPTELLERWLRALGYKVAAPTWACRTLSVPTSFGAAPRFREGDAVVLELVPPGPASSGLMLMRYGTNSQTFTVNASGGSSIYVAVVPPTRCAVDLSVSSAGYASTHFETTGEPSVEELVESLTLQPRLRVSIGGRVHVAWESSASVFDRKDEIDIDLGVAGARCDAVITSTSGRRLFSAALPKDVAGAIAEVRNELISVDIDAGNLGRLVFRARDAKPRREHANEGIPRWVEQRRHLEKQVAVVFVRDGRRVLRFSAGVRSLPQLRALSRDPARRTRS